MVSKEPRYKLERSGMDVETCTDCGSVVTVFDTHRGEIICSTCGLVISDKIVDPGPEWRAFDSDQREKRTRVGAPMTYTIHDRGLSTIIDWKNKDFAGHEIPAKLRSQIYRLRRWQSRIRVSDATERNLTFALSELDRMASVLALPKTLRETAAKIYRSAVKSHLIRGRSIEGVAAASLYAACRMVKIPRTLQEIAETARVDKKEIGRSYRFVVSRLNLNSNPTKAIDYIARFVSELKLSSNVQKKAIEIVRMAERRGLTSGRGPTGVAAAAIYVASIMYKERRTQRDIARVSQVTEVTVRNRFKELISKLNLDIPLKRK
ncbi:MAG: transcription initiation factor IIB [archaeon]|nr:transcription initiation factor IIB [archaeon]